MDKNIPGMDHARTRAFRRRTDIEKPSIASVSSETELRIAIEATGLGIFDYHPLTGELHWTHTAKEHFGLSADAFVNYNVFLVGLHPDDRDRVDKLVRDALQRENEGRFGTEYRTIGIEDGKERWIAARGQAFFNDHREGVRFIGTTQDITDRKRMEQELRESREHYRLLFDKSPLPKMVFDQETFSFLEFNEAALERYGYGRDDIAGLSVADIRTPDEFRKLKDWVKECAAANQKIAGRVRTQHRIKNQVVDVETQCTQITYKGRRAVLDVIVDAAPREGRL